MAPPRWNIPYELDVRLLGLVGDAHVRLPPYPAVASRLERLVRSDDFDLARLARVVSADQVLSASVMRLARSAASASKVPIGSLDRAIGRLGSEAVVRLAIASGVGAHAHAPGALASLRREAWRRAVWSAEVARELAPLFRLDSGVAFLAGLLHDFGALVTYGSLEEIVSGNPQAPALSAARCREVAETYHVELGLLVAEHWNLPAEVRQAIGEHHRASPRSEPIVRLVADTDRVVARLEEGLPVVAVLQDSPFPGTARVLLEALLPTLPEVLQRFEPERPVPQTSTEVLERLPTTLGPDARSASFRASVGTLRLRGTKVAGNGFEVEAPRPLAEESVVKVTLESDEGPFDLWARVALHEPGRCRHRLELEPLALDPDVELRWRALRGAHPPPLPARRSA